MLLILLNFLFIAYVGVPICSDFSDGLSASLQYADISMNDILSDNITNEQIKIFKQYFEENFYEEIEEQCKTPLPILEVSDQRIYEQIQEKLKFVKSDKEWLDITKQLQKENRDKYQDAVKSGKEQADEFIDYTGN